MGLLQDTQQLEKKTDNSVFVWLMPAQTSNKQTLETTFLHASALFSEYEINFDN